MAFEMAPWFIALLVALAIWELIWKGIALWRAGRSNQLPWFIAILVLNTAGILPIIYLVWFQKEDAPVTVKAVTRPAAKKKK